MTSTVGVAWYKDILKTMDKAELEQEWAGLVAIAPKFEPYLSCLVEEFERRNP